MRKWTVTGALLVSLLAAACGNDDDGDTVGLQSAPLRNRASVTRVSSSLSQNPLTVGQTQTETVTLGSRTTLTGLIVDIRLYDSAQHLVAKTTFDAVTIAAGGTVTLHYDYPSPATLPLGTYAFTVGVWNAAWKTLLYETADSFAVVAPAAAAPPPAPPAPAPPADAGTSCAFPDWVEYQFYPAGSIVTYQGGAYVAKHDNPGYIPTVSTYYWAPYACAPTATTPVAPVDAGAAPSGSGILPAKIVGGYFTTWDDRNGVNLRSIVDNTSYNLIYLAFATGTSASSGALRLDLPAGATSAADFKTQIAYANSKGRAVVVSVGGWYDLGGVASGYVLDSSAKVDDFMASMRDLRSSWGFNGMDWDLEHGDRPDVAGIVDASRRMKNEFGSSWIITSAPGVNMQSWVGPSGVLDVLGPSGWDIVGEQIYDWGISQSDYQTLIVDRMTALSNKYGASKVVLGNAYKTDTASSSLANPQNRWVGIPTTLSALGTLRSSGVNIRGAFTWTIQADSDTGYLWQAANGVGGDILNHP
jgi:chitinase